MRIHYLRIGVGGEKMTPLFEKKNTFAQHISLLNNHIATLTNSSEDTKKQLLLRSADSKIGDYHLSVNRLINGGVYVGDTYQEICDVLESLYVDKNAKDIHIVSKRKRNGAVRTNRDVCEYPQSIRIFA